MNVIHSIRNRKAVESGKLFVGFLLAGYPDKQSFLDIIKGCDCAGIDVFEVGFPANDPFYDGEVIRSAQQKTDKNICRDIDYWEKIRRATNKPIWLMGYRADLIESGFYKILASKHLVDAYIIPELTMKERIDMARELEPFGIDIMGFINPNQCSSEKRICFENFSLVYQQLYDGPTGMAVVTDDYKDLLEWALSYDHVYEFAGFGINSSARAEELLTGGFHGVIIGSSMICRLNESKDKLYEFTRELAATVRKVNRS